MISVVFWVVTKCPVEGQYPDIGRSSSQRKMITKIRARLLFWFHDEKRGHEDCCDNYRSSKKVDNFSGQVQHWETMMHGGTGGDYM